MTKKQLLIFSATLGFLLVFGGTTWLGPGRSLAAATPQEAAQQELPAWLENVRHDDVTLYGFVNEEELARATLGTPFQVFELTPAAIQTYQAGHNVAPLLAEQAVWVFPVLVDDQARGLFTVAQVDGQWQAVEFGFLPQSKQLDKLRKKLAKSKVTVKFVKVFPLDGTFALIEQGQKESLVHLTSYPGLFTNLDRNNLTAYGPEQFMPEMKKALQQVLDEQKRVEEAATTP